MKEIKLGVCFLDERNDIVSKRVVGTKWSVIPEQDLKEKFNKYMKEEVAKILTENLNLQLSSDIIRSMLIEIKDQKLEDQTIKLGIYFSDSDDNVLSKRNVVVDWDIFTENLYEEYYDSKMEEMVSKMQLLFLERSLSYKVVEEMLEEIKERST
ncbi:MAG: hypothetical protein ACFFG0_01010 [Candidatus Thorarchaeota archaeon]